MRINYNGTEVASSIANHDSRKHYNNQKSTWEKHGVNGFEQFTERVQNTIDDKSSSVYSAINNKDLYYNSKTKMLVIVNMISKDKGTAFYAEDDKEFKRYIRKDKAHRKCFRKYIDNKRGIVAKENKLYISKSKPYRTIKQLNKNSNREKEKIQNFTINKEKIVERRQKALLAKHKTDIARQKRAEINIENEGKKARIAALQKKAEQDAQLKLDAQKKKDAAPKTQQPEKEQVKDHANQNDIKTKQQNDLQEELERQRLREAQLKALEKARLQNSHDLSKRR